MHCLKITNTMMADSLDLGFSVLFSELISIVNIVFVNLCPLKCLVETDRI